jgi:hypothetical protein
VNVVGLQPNYQLLFIDLSDIALDLSDIALDLSVR